MDHQWHAGKSQMKIGGPAGLGFSNAHRVQTDRVREGQFLIGETLEHRRCRSHLAGSDCQYLERWHVFDHCQELQRSRAIVAAQKPGMALSDD